MPENVTQLLTLLAVAKALCVSPHTVRSWVRQGKLHPLRICRRLIFDPIEIARFLTEHSANNKSAANFRARADAGADSVKETAQMQTTIDTLCELERQRFFGTLEIKFEAGRIVLLRKTETIKPIVETCRNTRGDDDGRPR